MTPAQASKLFMRLRGQFAAHDPALHKLVFKLRRRHFLPHPKPRDLAWYDSRDGTVNLMVQALDGPSGRVEGLLAHELGHALDKDSALPYAERRADALAKRVLGQPVRYDKDDVQNTLRGVTPRPSRLPENREAKMKNPDKYAKAQYPYEVYYQRKVKGKIKSGSVPLASMSEAKACVQGMKRSPDVIEAFIRKRNPAKGYRMPETQARHTAEGLLARMKADGANTFAKKVKWVKRHMPNIGDPVPFVGWVTKGERGRVVLSRNPAKGVVRVAARNKKGRPIVLESVYFESAGPFVRSKALDKSETVQSVEDDWQARIITHTPTGVMIYAGGLGWSATDPKKEAVACMKNLRQWLKKLSKDEVRIISDGFVFGSRDLTPAQDKLLREANQVCRSGKILRNPPQPDLFSRAPVRTVSKSTLVRKPKWMQEAVGLIGTAYAPIGGHANLKSAKDIRSDDADVYRFEDIDADYEPDVLQVSKTTPYGLKTIAMGHDGTKDAKRRSIAGKIEDFKEYGNYGEVSGRLAEIVLSAGVPVIGDPRVVEKVLNKKIKWVGSDPAFPSVYGWYERMLGGHMHRKILVGLPNVVKNPSFANAPVRPYLAQAIAR